MKNIKVTSVNNSAGYIETEKTFTNLPKFDTSEKAEEHISAMMEREVQADLKTFRETPEIITYIAPVGEGYIKSVRSVAYPSSGELVNNPTFRFNGIYRYNRLSDSELRLYSRSEIEANNA